MVPEWFQISFSISVFFFSLVSQNALREMAAKFEKREAELTGQLRLQEQLFWQLQTEVIQKELLQQEEQEMLRKRREAQEQARREQEQVLLQEERLRQETLVRKVYHEAVAELGKQWKTEMKEEMRQKLATQEERLQRRLQRRSDEIRAEILARVEDALAKGRESATRAA